MVPLGLLAALLRKASEPWTLEEVTTVQPGTVYRVQVTLPKGDGWPRGWERSVAYWLRQKGSAVQRIKVHYGPKALRDFYDPKTRQEVTWWVVDLSFDAPFLAYWLEDALTASLDTWVELKSVSVSSGVTFPEVIGPEQILAALKAGLAAIFLFQLAQLGFGVVGALRRKEA